MSERRRVNIPDKKVEPGDPEKKIPENVFWITSAIARTFGREYYLLVISRELLFYIIFIFCVTFPAAEKLNSMTYFMSDAIEGQLIKTPFKAATNTVMTFENISRTDHFYKYMKDVVPEKTMMTPFSSFSTEKQLLGPSEDRGVLYHNKFISRITIRQVAARNNTCHPRFAKYFKNCFGEYDILSRYPTKALEPCTLYCDYYPVSKKSGEYNEGTGGTVHWGKVAKYAGDGYFLKLANNKDNFVQNVDQLEKNQWINIYTRAVFVDMQFYNPHVDLFSAVKLILEIPGTGHLIPSYRITTFICDKEYTNKANRIASGCRIVYCLFILYYIAKEIREIFFFGWSTFYLFWSYVNWIIIISSLVHFITFYMEVSECAEIFPQFSGSVNNYFPIQQLARYEDISNSAQAIAILLVYLKLLSYFFLRVNMARIYYTLKVSFVAIRDLFIWFFIVLFAFAMVGHVFFGSQVEQFSTLDAASMTLIKTFIGDFFYEEIDKYHWNFGPFYFTLFIIVMYLILIHFFVAILSVTYTAVKTDMGLAPNRIQLGGFWGRGFSNCLKDYGCANCVPISLANERYSASAEEIRQILKSCGFSDMDIDMFMSRYNINPREEIRRRDVPKLIETIRVPTVEIPQKNRSSRASLVLPSEHSSVKSDTSTSSPQTAVGLNDYKAQQERLDRIERLMAVVAERLEGLLKLMNDVEQARMRPRWQ